MVGEGKFFNTIGADQVTELPGGANSDGALKINMISGNLLYDGAGNVLLAIGTTVPTDATAGYAIGGIFIDTDGTTVAKLFCNIGTAASCNFNQVTIAADA